MKIIALISRLLLGLTFLVFGLNGFLHFIPMALPSGVAGQFLTALFASRYFLAVAAVMVIAGVLLLINRYVPLALTLLGPVIVNILLFHFLMAPEDLAIALFVGVLWIALFTSVRSAFAGIFRQRVQTDALPAKRHTRVVQEA
jgi:putative oxidoreductase